MIRLARSTHALSLIFTLAITAALARAGTPGDSNSAPPRDWNAVASQANQSLATALDEAARGRAVDARLRAVTANYDDLLTHAPLSDRDRARILYNRALADLALRDPASAVYDLRRSEALAPGRADTARELELARTKLKESESPTTPASSAPVSSAAPSAPRENPAAQAWSAIRRIHPSLRWSTGLSAFVAAWLLLMPLLLTSSRPARRWLGVAAVGALVLAFVSIGTLVAERRMQPDLPDLVVTADDCTPRQGPDLVAYPATSFNGQSSIPRGTELQAIEIRSLPENPAAIAWVRVRERSAIKDGASVWIRSTDAGWVSPPQAPDLRNTTPSPTAAGRTPPRAPATPTPPARSGSKPNAPAADAATRT